MEIASFLFICIRKLVLRWTRQSKISEAKLRNCTLQSLAAHAACPQPTRSHPKPQSFVSILTTLSNPCGQRLYNVAVTRESSRTDWLPERRLITCCPSG